MAAPTFSVIIPTVGRRSLRHTLASVAEQLEPGDEILVLCNRDGDFGNAARESLTTRARGTHLLYLDDDDQFTRGALETMRRFARENPGRVGIFRMRYLSGRKLWREPALFRTNVSTQTFCVPNLGDRLGSWTKWPQLESRTGRTYDVADYEFIAETVRLLGHEPIFRTEVVARYRGDRRFLPDLSMRAREYLRVVARRIRASLRPK